MVLVERSAGRVWKSVSAVLACSGSGVLRAGQRRHEHNFFGSTILADRSISTDETWLRVPIDHQVPGQEAEQRQLQHRRLSENRAGNTRAIPSLDRVALGRERAYRQLTTRGSVVVQRSDGLDSFSLWMTR